jgi:hypothetical protein
MMEKIKKIPQVKCGLCEIKSDKPLMIQDINKKYYHREYCHDKYLVDKEFRRIEASKKLAMSLVIARVYGLSSYKLIPPAIYPHIEDIRNDSELFGRLGKNYKNGIKYEGIAYTYEFVRDKIQEADRTKVFKNEMDRFKYGLTIVRNNLGNAKSHFELSQMSKETSKIKMNNIDNEVKENIDNEEVVYKSKKTINDISKYL